MRAIVVCMMQAYYIKQSFNCWSCGTGINSIEKLMTLSYS